LEKYLTCDDVASLYHVKKITVWQWIRDGKLNAIQTGKVYAIRPQDLREFEEARSTKAKG
jgi:excisionase family DNA binding protein